MGSVQKGVGRWWLEQVGSRVAIVSMTRYRGVWATLGLLAAVLFVIWWAWGKWGRNVVDDPAFQVKAGQIVLPPAPKWIRSDIRAEALRESSLERLSLLDPEVTLKIRRAFELHPWVASVEYVSKRAGGRILVEVKYRRPIIMVVTENGNGWWPVDTMGVLLPPADFSQNDPLGFFQVYTPFHRPAGDVGTSFGHAGVVGAARLATLLDDHRKQWGLVSIHVHHLNPARESEIEYELRTKGGTRILWGAAPGNEPRGESTAEEKLARLEQFAAARGTLDLRPPVALDIRHTLTHVETPGGQ